MPKAKLTLETFNKTINTVLLLLDRCRIPWFICFGSLLGLVRDKGVIEGDHDIDIGFPFEYMSEKRICACFQRYDYKIYKRIRIDSIDMSDITAKRENLAYISFIHSTMPTVDLFAWYLHEGIRYHTYDYMNEGKEIPTQYHWKGIRDEWLKRVEKSMFGTIKHPLFSRNVPFPFMYGHLLDHWYPDWKTPRSGESHTPWHLVLDSCKQFGNKKLIREQLEKSERDFDGFVRTIK